VATIYFKSCPRCSGDIIWEKDHNGAFNSCLACGYVTYPNLPRQIQALPMPMWSARADSLHQEPLLIEEPELVSSTSL
jgi:hypothetical protein